MAGLLCGKYAISGVLPGLLTNSMTARRASHALLTQHIKHNRPSRARGRPIGPARDETSGRPAGPAAAVTQARGAGGRRARLGRSRPCSAPHLIAWQEGPNKRLSNEKTQTDTLHH